MAATDGLPETPADDPIVRRFRLFDAAGAPIPPEGIPAGIPVVDGARVILLHPPQGRFQWQNGRTYAGMIPSLTLDEVMPAEQTRAWLDKTAHAGAEAGRVKQPLEA
jgi:hypothetical protein